MWIQQQDHLEQNMVNYMQLNGQDLVIINEKFEKCYPPDSKIMVNGTIPTINMKKKYKNSGLSILEALSFNCYSWNWFYSNFANDEFFNSVY